MESIEIRHLFMSLKEKEKDLQSISPKVVDLREKIKNEISDLQKRINELRIKEGAPINRPKRI